MTKENVRSYDEIYKLRIGFRLVIVILVWFVASLFPNDPISLFQTIFVASITSLYEYVIIFIENIYDSARKSLCVIGILLSIIYIFIAFLGFSGLLILDIQTKTFSLGSSFPYHDYENIKWSYYLTVYPMLFFPGIATVELFLKNPQKSSEVA